MATYTPAQAGSELIGLAWQDESIALNRIFLQNAVWATGLQYTLPDPDNILYRSMVLTLTPNFVGGTGAGTLTIGICNDLNEAVFDATNLPTNQNTITTYNSAVTFVVATPLAITLDLGAQSLQTGSFVGEFGTPMQVIGNSGFGGNMALVLTWSGALVRCDAITGTEPTLVTEEAPFYTGLPSSKQRQSRADYCARCGGPVFREQLVKDGYAKTLVCPSCYDPPERRRKPWKPPKEINP